MSTSSLPAGRFGRFEIVPSERRLTADGRTVALGSRAFDLLAALVARRDRIVPKDELIDVVWPGLVVEDNNLQVQISALRKVLGTQAIATVPGRGYQFTIAAGTTGAPATSVAEAKTPRVQERSMAGAQRKSRLLVADDNKVNRLLLCRSLELMGHAVASVENGRVALEALRSEDFDMLLLDLEMPELDGFGLLEQRAADAALHGVPVIVTSSLEGAAQVARCIELGADDYLHKPVNPVLLKARVGASLDRKHLRDRERELLARLAPELGNGERSAGDAGGRRGECTLLVARLRDIDALAMTQPAQDTLELLSSWTTLMLDTIEEAGGLVNQLAGDGMTAVFGSRGPMPAGNAPAAAVEAARGMRALVAQFNAERGAPGKPPLVIGIGIASGEMVTGHAGTPTRAAYVSVGAAAQRAVRLASLAAERGASVVLDAATRAALPGDFGLDALSPLPLPGSGEAAVPYVLRP